MGSLDRGAVHNRSAKVSPPFIRPENAMRKLYSGFSARDASVQVQVWLEPETNGPATGRVISLAAFRAEAEIASERHVLPSSETRGLSELVPSLLAQLDTHLVEHLGIGRRVH